MDLRDLLVVARSVTEAAMREPVSVGAHYLENPEPASADITRG